jgi:glycosyltransferase involved in cell wall biosynthesis
VRFLILTADYSPSNWSGIGVAVANQATAISGLGYEVNVLSQRASLPDRFRGGVNFHCLDGQRFPLRPAYGDVIHLHSLSLAKLAIEVSRRFSLPLLYTAHSLLQKELDSNQRATLWIRLQHLLFSRADHIFFLSRADREAGLDVCPAMIARSSILPHGIAPLRSRRTTNQTGGPIVFAGRFCFSKGTDVFVKAAVELLKRHSCLQFVIAGGHGNAAESASVADFAHRFPKNCQTPGWLTREKLDELFASASLVLVPSRYEPFGMVALEALRTGAPVLGAATGGLAEILKPRSGGGLVANHDPMEWADRAEVWLNPKYNTKTARKHRIKFVETTYGIAPHIETLVSYAKAYLC